MANDSDDNLEQNIQKPLALLIVILFIISLAIISHIKYFSTKPSLPAPEIPASPALTPPVPDQLPDTLPAQKEPQPSPEPQPLPKNPPDTWEQPDHDKNENLIF